MPQILTPILAVASAGILEGKGFAVPAALTTSINNYNALAITTAAQSILANSSTEIKTAVSTVPSCLTGIVPTSLRNTVPSNISSEFYYDNLISDVAQRAALIMSNDVLGLTTIIPRIQGACSNAFELKGMYQQMKESTFDDFGVTVGSYTDSMTGGINSQFAELIGGINNSSARAMLTQLGEFGTMFDITEPGRMYDPVVLCQNLLNQGFYLISELLTQGGISIGNLDTVDIKKLLSVLGTISGIELKAITTVTNFKSAFFIENLGQVLDATKLFSPNALVAAGGSLTALSNKLSNIGGRFSSFKDLSDTYLNTRTSPVPRLTGLGALGTNELFANAIGKIGSGTGVFANPSIYDYIGVITGEGYTDNINRLSVIQTQILATPQGAALKSAIESAVSVAAINSATAALTGSTNPVIVQLLAEGQTRFAAVFDRLLTERKNSKSSQIDYAEPIGSIDSVTSFVLELHNAWNDPMELKYSDFLRKMLTDDIFGEAINAGINEGYNLAMLSNKGVPTYTKLDPVAYSTVVKTRPVC
jgi:hypothetical protein